MDDDLVTLGIAIGVFLIIGGAASTAGAAEPIPGEPSEPSEPTPAAIDPDALAKMCDLDGLQYDSKMFPDPQSVITELRALGYQASGFITGGPWKQQIKRFQRHARTLFLNGMGAAPDSYIDGVMGACTLRALKAARARRINGAWDGPLD